jgi:hypothetical protein
VLLAVVGCACSATAWELDTARTSRGLLLSIHGAFGQQRVAPLRAEIDLLTVDVQVVASRNQPVASLTADDFQISISKRARPVILVEFLHLDEGPITRGLGPRLDAGTSARCIFGFARSQAGANAHYRIGVESIADDARGIKQPKIRLRAKNLSLRRFAWRSR